MAERMEEALVRSGEPEDSTAPTGKLRKELSIWEAIGISVALMAPSMAANINPQGSALTVGRAVPLTFVLATIGVLLVAYTFVRLCQQFHHAGSVYGFVGATLGPRAGVVAGWSLMGTYGFYGVVTAMAAGIFGAAFLDAISVWNDQPDWAGFLVGGILLLGVLGLAIRPIRHATRLLLTVEGTTVALILIVPGGPVQGDRRHRAHEHELHVQHVHGAARRVAIDPVPRRRVRVPVLRGVRGGGDARRGGQEPAPGHPARDPRRGDLRRRVLRLRHRGRDAGLRNGRSGRGRVRRLVLAARRARDAVRRLVGRHVITLGTAISAFGCALACTVGCSRLLFALTRDGVGPTASRRSGSHGTPGAATILAVLACTS